MEEATLNTDEETRTVEQDAAAKKLVADDSGTDGNVDNSSAAQETVDGADAAGDDSATDVELKAVDETPTEDEDSTSNDNQELVAAKFEAEAAMLEVEALEKELAEVRASVKSAGGSGSGASRHFILVNTIIILLIGGVIGLSLLTGRNISRRVETVSRHFDHQVGLLVDRIDTSLGPAGPTEEEIREKRQQAEELVNSGHRFFRDEDILHAVESYEKSLRHDLLPETRSLVHFQLGECHFRTEEYAKAIADYRAVLTNSLDSRYSVVAQFKIGEALFRLGEYVSARHEFFRVVARRDAVGEGTDSDLVGRAYYRIGDCYLREAYKGTVQGEQNE